VESQKDPACIQEINRKESNMIVRDLEIILKVPGGSQKNLRHKLKKLSAES
jgi:hypothetical protein